MIDLGESSIPDVIPPPANEADRNARINPGETLVPKGQGAKIAANFKVIELLRALVAESRNPTEAEKAQLLTYSGWGHSKGGFDDAKAKAFEQISDNGDQDAYYNRMWRTMPKEQFKRQYNYHSTNAQGKEDASNLNSSASCVLLTRATAMRAASTTEIPEPSKIRAASAA